MNPLQYSGEQTLKWKHSYNQSKSTHKSGDNEQQNNTCLWCLYEYSAWVHNYEICVCSY